MPLEIEAKFLRVNHDEIRAKLVAAGAKLEHPMRLMRRELFDYPDGRFQKKHLTERLRIRDEGDKVTITYKNSKTESDYVHEIETTVGSYENMNQLLKAIGLEVFSYQESKRETWQLGNVEVVLDEWPWLDTYIEIEGPAEDDIKIVASQLGFDWSDAKFGSVDTAYCEQYPKMSEQESIGDLPEVRFNEPLPAYLKQRM